VTYYPGMPNFERKSFSVATGSAEVTDEMWDAIFGVKCPVCDEKVCNHTRLPLTKWDPFLGPPNPPRPEKRNEFA